MKDTTIQPQPGSRAEPAQPAVPQTVPPLAFPPQEKGKQGNSSANGSDENVTKLILDTLTQHAEAIGVITTRLLALQAQLDKMAGHTPAEPNQSSARPVSLS